MRRPLLGAAERQTLYVPTGMLDELRVEARRQDRSMSWLVATAWRIAREKIKELPGPMVTP